VISDAGPCQGLIGGWGVDLYAFSVGVRGIACRGVASNAFLDATEDQLAAELRAVHAWDVHRITLSAGPLIGLSLLSERFSTQGTAPMRNSLAANAGLTGALSVDLAGRVYLTAELDGITAFFRAQAMETVALRAAFALRVNFLVGARW
jgi:hypothetical protein